MLAPAAAARCPGCQYFLRLPEILPFLRRPGARLALLAGFLGILGAVSYGLSAAAGMALAAWALAALRSEDNRRLAPGVRLLAAGALAISLAGLVLGGWGLYGRYLQPHWQGIHDWERRQTVLNTFRVLTAAEMRYNRRHPRRGFSARLDQLTANGRRLGVSPALLFGAYTFRRFGYDYRYRPNFGRPSRGQRGAPPAAKPGPARVNGYRIFARPAVLGAGPCYVCGPDGLPQRLPCRPLRQAPRFR